MRRTGKNHIPVHRPLAQNSHIRVEVTSACDCFEPAINPAGKPRRSRVRWSAAVDDGAVPPPRFAPFPTMLRYMNRGQRTGSSPHPLGLSRGNWEIFAVVRGSIRLLYPGKAAAGFHSRRIWLLPPESPHSWSTPPEKSCEVSVFHFASIHSLLESSLPSDRTLSVPLDDSGVQLLDTLHQELTPHYRAPRFSSVVHFEAAMLRLCALFLDRDRDVTTLAAFDGGSETILRAEQWHREHLGDGVRINDVAAALHVSPSQLRRLFLRVRGELPKRVFMRARIEEACRLMAQGGMNLKEVSARCGFSGFSEFYRAFKNHTGQSPSRWRSNQLYRGLGIVTSAPGPVAPAIAELNQPPSRGNQFNSSARAV